jgi:hypothetical protein
MYLRLYRYRSGFNKPQHGEDFNASAVVKTSAFAKATADRMADRKARRGNGAKRGRLLPSSLPARPLDRFPRLQNVKEQARERRTQATIPHLDGTAIYFLQNLPQTKQNTQKWDGEFPPIPVFRPAICQSR